MKSTIYNILFNVVNIFIFVYLIYLIYDNDIGFIRCFYAISLTVIVYLYGYARGFECSSKVFRKILDIKENEK